MATVAFDRLGQNGFIDLTAVGHPWVADFY